MPTASYAGALSGAVKGMQDYFDDVKEDNRAETERQHQLYMLERKYELERLSQEQEHNTTNSDSTSPPEQTQAEKFSVKGYEFMAKKVVEQQFKKLKTYELISFEEAWDCKFYLENQLKDGVCIFFVANINNSGIFRYKAYYEEGNLHWDIYNPSPLTPEETIELMKIQIKHPDWKKLHNSEKFRSWIHTQPKSIKTKIQSDYAIDIIEVIDKYKKENAML